MIWIAVIAISIFSFWLMNLYSALKEIGNHLYFIEMHLGDIKREIK